MFTEAQLVSFGNYLLETYGVKVFSGDGKNTPITQREVSHADMSNWKDTNITGESGIKLPAQFQIKEKAILNLFGNKVDVEITSVHFYTGKVKYDLKIIAEGVEITRLYNIDSAFVTKKN